MPRGIVDPRERGLASGVTILAPINGAIVPLERLMGAHMAPDIPRRGSGMHTSPFWTEVRFYVCVEVFAS